MRFDGAAEARPAPGVIDAIESAETIIVAPCNPIVSIGPVLAVPGIRESVEKRRDRTVADLPDRRGRGAQGPR